MDAFGKQRLIEEYQNELDEILETVGDIPDLQDIHGEDIDRIKMKLEKLKEVE